MISTAEFHWLAGLLEGEGYFAVTQKTLKIELRMTDEDVVCRAQLLLHCRNARLRVRQNAADGYQRKPIYKIEVTGRAAAAWMMTLYSLMGIRRKAKIRECLGKWRRIRLGNGFRQQCLRGHPYDRFSMMLIPTRRGRGAVRTWRARRGCTVCIRARQLRAQGRFGRQSDSKTGVLFPVMG
jgi:hypothetical protein